MLLHYDAGGQVGPEVAQQCMKTAFDLGINFFDTAEVRKMGLSL